MDDKIFEMFEKLYGRMEDGFKEIRTEMATKEDVARLEGNLARLEHAHGQKLDALFDGYKSNTEAIQGLRTDVQLLKKEVENHEIKLKLVK